MISMRVALATGAMAASMLLGCGGDESMLVPGLPSDFTGPGVYTVPAAPGVSFAVSQVQVKQWAGTVGVYYELPTEFFAQAPDVTLTGTADGTGTIHLTGAAGTSTCTVETALLRCDENLSGVQFYAAQAKAALPPSDPRVSAVAAFTSEPIGVLSVALSGSAGAL
jgi:hypothetical protein